MKQRFLLLILILFGFLFSSSAKAATSPRGCVTDTMKNGIFCASAELKSWCTNNTNTCAVESTTPCPSNPSNGTYAFSCNDNSCHLSCSANYLVCGGTSCVYNDPALHCATLTGSNCNAGQCASCVGGYSLCSSANTCVQTQSCSPGQTFDPCTASCIGFAGLKLGSDSISGVNVIQSPATPTLYIPSSGYVGLGITNPGAKLDLAPTTGYAMLSGNYKIGNVALPTSDTDAASKAYVDTVLAGGSGTTVGYWIQNGTDISNSNTGNVGIGMTNPISSLDVLIGNGSLPNDVRGRGIASEYYGVGAWGGKGGIAIVANGTKASPTAVAVNDIASLAQPIFYDGTKWRVGPRIDAIVRSVSNNVSVGSALALYTGTTTGDATAGQFTGITERMRIDESGNVGIGITNPAAVLEIKNPGAGGLQTWRNSAGTVVASMGLWGTLSINSANANLTGLTVLGGASLNHGAHTSDASNALSAANTAIGVGMEYGIYSTITGAGVSNTAGYFSATGATNNYGLIVANGNVGIGLTNPGAKLELAPMTGYALLAGNYKIGNVASPTIDSDVATMGWVNSALSSAGGGLWGGATSGNIWNLNSGSIGIGTTAPTSKLHVYGTTDPTVTIATPGSAFSPTLLFTNQTDSFLESINGGEFRLTDVNGNKYYSVSTSAVQTLYSPLNSPAMTINAGSVGIGTTNPKSKLQIAGNMFMANTDFGAMSTKAVTLRVDEGYDAFRFGVPGNWAMDFNAVSSGAANSRLDISNSTSGPASPLVSFKINGNVGIGTTNPSYKLDVTHNNTSLARFINTATSGATAGAGMQGMSDDGAAMVTGDRLGFYLLGGATNATHTLTNSAGMAAYAAGNWSGTSAPADLAFEITPSGTLTRSEIMRISNIGTVGIGITNPTGKLEVAPTTGYAMLAGNYRISNVATPTSDSDVATMGWVNSALTGISGIATYVGMTASTYTGSNSGTPGYNQANSLCNTAQAGSHVCTSFEVLYSIASGVSMPAANVWILNGPPAYTASANDCEGRTSASGSSYGAYWEAPSGSYPQGRGLLGACSGAAKLACCK